MLSLALAPPVSSPLGMICRAVFGAVAVVWDSRYLLGRSRTCGCLFEDVDPPPRVRRLLAAQRPRPSRQLSSYRPWPSGAVPGEDLIGKAPAARGTAVYRAGGDRRVTAVTSDLTSAPQDGASRELGFTPCSSRVIFGALLCSVCVPSSDPLRGTLFFCA